jgi:uncharacterized protein (TIGR03382 family)
VLSALIFAGVAAAGVGPWSSYGRLVSANGVGVLGFRAEGGEGVLDRFSDHLYQQYAPTQDPVLDLLYDAYFGVRVGGAGGWSTAVDDVGYVPGTPILRVRRPGVGGLRLTEYAYAPPDFPAAAYVHLLVLENPGTAPVDFTAFQLQNAHLGAVDAGGARTRAERLSAEDGALVEVGAETGLSMAWVPVRPADLACDSVWATVVAGGTPRGGCPQAGDDRTGAFTWELSLAPGETEVLGAIGVYAWGPGLPAARSAAEAWRAGRDGAALLADAEAAWAARLGPARFAPGLSADEAAVARQALVFLLMGQVVEPGEAHGQIPASLPASAPVGDFTHQWNITWVRDAAYAIHALAAAGYSAEAADALRFFVQPGKSGEYASWIGVDTTAISVCRTYGNGLEWSDWDAFGPNIELDNFGLYLWVFAAVALDAGDSALLADLGPTVLDGVADVLVATADAETGLVIADSSIWERHWYGNQKRFTYTSAWAVRGLRDAARIATALGDPRAATYTARADTIAAAIPAWLVRDDGVLVGNLEEHRAGAPALDIAAVDTFLNGALSPRGPVAAASRAAWASALAVPGGGLKRNDDGDLYDEQEWIWADLRLAEAHFRACAPAEGQSLLDRVTGFARANHDTIPELLHPETAAFAGPAPMMGFGSALYLDTLHARAEAAVDCASPDPDTGADTGPSPDSGGEGGGGAGGDGATDSGPGAGGGKASPSNLGDGGCGCASSSSAAVLLPVALASVAALRRRRRPA